MRPLVVIALIGCGRINFDPLVDDGLLLWYPLDDELDGIARDATGGGRHATCAVGANCPTPIAGRRDGAAMFDGTSQRLRRIFDDGLATPTAFTIAAWMYPDAFTTFNAVFAKPSMDAANSNTWILEMPTTQIAELRAWSSSLGNRNVSGPPVALATWTHLAGTWDGTMLRLFVDGAMVGELAFPDLSVDTGDILIGADDGSGGEGSFFQGRIDDVRLYDRALSPDEVMTLTR